jgi:hypothetical protein
MSAHPFTTSHSRLILFFTAACDLVPDAVSIDRRAYRRLHHIGVRPAAIPPPTTINFTTAITFRAR